MKSMSPWMVRVRSTAHFFVFIIGVSPTAFSRMSIFFLVSPAGSSVPGETEAEEGGSGVAVPGELSVGPSPSAPAAGASGRTDSESSAILLRGRRERKWGLSACSGRALRRGKSLRRRHSRWIQPNSESWRCPLVFYVESVAAP